MRHRPALRSRVAIITAVVLLGALSSAPGVAVAQGVPAPVTVSVSVRAIVLDVAVAGGPCTVQADLYTPSTATAVNRAAAILTTNGFGGSKADQADIGRGFGALGYVVLSYSGLGFGGSSCKITLDDRTNDGAAASQLAQWLGGSPTVKARDATSGADVVVDNVVRQDAASGLPNDPAVGMIGGSYGGEVQFAAAAVDRRIDTLIPLITWNDLAFSLAPNGANLPPSSVSYPASAPGVSKFEWSTLFFALGFGVGAQNAQADVARLLTTCPNFEGDACRSKTQLDTQGYPDSTTVAYARSKSVASYLDAVKVPVLLGQGEADTLFTLQEAVATYDALRARNVPVAMQWQSWGHSRSKPRPGELDLANPMTTYQGRVFAAWFDHYLRGTGLTPPLDFSYYRPWADTTGNAADAYTSAPSYPVATPLGQAAPVRYERTGRQPRRCRARQLDLRGAPGRGAGQLHRDLGNRPGSTRPRRPRHVWAMVDRAPVGPGRFGRLPQAHGAAQFAVGHGQPGIGTRRAAGAVCQALRHCPGRHHHPAKPGDRTGADTRRDPAGHHRAACAGAPCPDGASHRAHPGHYRRRLPQLSGPRRCDRGRRRGSDPVVADLEH